MPTYLMRGSRSARRAAVIAAAVALSAAGCTDRLLQATDPDLIFASQLDTPEGADALRIGALNRWRLATGGDNTNGQESTWLTGGLLADEWSTSSTFVQNDELDERKVKLDNSTVTYDFRKLNRVRTAVNQALPAMKKWRPTESLNIAELYLARGHTEMQLASDFCNGIPLSDGTQEVVVPGTPLKVSEVFDVALATLDSGLALVQGTADSTSDVARALHIIKARALLGNARFADAAAEVNKVSIPLTFSYNHTYAATSGSNALWGQPNSSRRYNVGDSLEGNAHDILVHNNIPFFSSKDPRVPSKYTISSKGDTTKSQDGITFSRTTSIWGRETPVAVANGIDAALIKAEAALQAGNFAGAGGTLEILNNLRAAKLTLGTVTVPAMPALTDPGTQAAEVDLLFREKAFWTFSRGERLGDLRRLIRQYGRTPQSTFPWSDQGHYRGGEYGPDVNLPVPKDEEGNNPNFHGCLDRNA